MGQRGPKPLPKNVHLLHGNPGKKPLASLLDEFKPEVDIPGCPRHLMPEARKEWRRITPELQRYGLISKVDRAALAIYCQAYARWAWCEEQLQRSMALAAQKRADWEAKPENADQAWAGGDGFMIPTPNGAFTYSPHWVGANKAMEQVDKYLARFGLSPSSRSRVALSDNYPFLPGMEPEADKTGDAAQGQVKASLSQLVR